MSGFCKQIKIYTLRKYEIGFQVFRSFFLGLPVQSLYFYSNRIKVMFQHDLQQEKFDTIYCQLSRTAFYTKDLKLRKVIDFQDAFAMNYLRIQEQSAGIKKWFYKRESILMSKFEASILNWFDATTIISEFDKSNLSVQPNSCVVVGNGIDTTWFTPRRCDKNYDILFAGNLNYLPNKFALKFLLEHLFPLLLNAKPTITIQITGGYPKEYKALANQYPNHLFLRGWIDDIRDAYAESRVFVAPLFTGAGVQNKILEAMSMEVPCVTTKVVNASLNAAQDTQIYLAENEHQFIEKIMLLLQDGQVSSRIAAEARRFVTEHFSWEKNTEILEEQL